MEWSLQYLPRRSVVLARLEGDYEPMVVPPFLQALGAACRQHSPRAVLIDRRRSALKLSTMSIYGHPQDYRNAGITPSLRIALVVAAKAADERFLENVFLNQGYRLKLFDDWRRAVTWVGDSRRQG